MDKSNLEMYSSDNKDRSHQVCCINFNNQKEVVFISRKESLNKKKAWLLCGITLAIVILIAVVSIRFIPRYSQPEYTVSSYRALIQEFSGETKYLFPKEERLPGEAVSFTVYLKSRFSGEKIGYSISLARRKSRFMIAAQSPAYWLIHIPTVQRKYNQLLSTAVRLFKSAEMK